MSEPELKPVGTKEKFKDSRSHEERLQTLYEAFGECKQHAMATGRVNDCSLNKVAEKAQVTKSYLTGTREYDDKNVSKKYQDVNAAIQAWRKGFKNQRRLTAEQAELRNTKQENENLKRSVRPLIEEVNLLRRLTEEMPEAAKQKDEQILILQDKLHRLGTAKNNSMKIADFGVASSVARRIISPDSFRYMGGRYEYGDPVLNQKSIHKAYDELDQALSRDLPMRLYITVGLPCSGKTYWAERAVLCPDRHPVIFDATNLSKVDRLQLIHQIKGFDDLPVVCVVFDVEMTVIRERNLKHRTADRRVPDVVLDMMVNQFEKPSPYEETWLDELIVVRHSG